MAETLLAVAWVGITLYAVFGGADFGGGFWDLVAGDPRGGAPKRALIEASIGPVWEANHVWLIFVLVVLWTAFPPAFAQLASNLIVPLTAAAIGIILRGSGFIFRKVVTTVEQKRAFGATFALSSLVTPFFLGTIAGAVASGRIAAEGIGDLSTTWLNPTSIVAGLLATATCAYLAAVFLAAEASRRSPDLIEWFRRRALAAGVVAGIVALVGIAVLAADAPTLFDGLTSRGLGLVAVSGAGGLASLWLLWVRRLPWARLAAVVAVAAILWGWAAAQYPWILTDALKISEAAGSPATLQAMVIALGVGSLLFAPPLAYLLVLSQRAELESPLDDRGVSLGRNR